MAGLGAPKTGGRKAGTPNRATATVKALAQQYTDEAIAALAEIVRDTTAPAMARVKAAEALLDRGHGKPTQHIEAKVGPLDDMSDEELEHVLSILKAQMEAEQEDVAGHA